MMTASQMKRLMDGGCLIWRRKSAVRGSALTGSFAWREKVGKHSHFSDQHDRQQLFIYIYIFFFFLRLDIWIRPERWPEGPHHPWEAWWTGTEVSILFFLSFFLLIYATATYYYYLIIRFLWTCLFFLLHWGDVCWCIKWINKMTHVICHLLFCRMPDPDFSVNDVKMFVGKSSDTMFSSFIEYDVTASLGLSNDSSCQSCQNVLV